MTIGSGWGDVNQLLGRTRATGDSNEVVRRALDARLTTFIR
jgi:hypothetical protein